MPIIGVPRTKGPAPVPSFGEARESSYPASRYRDLIRATGPALYWRLNETDGQSVAHDFSDNLRDGTYVGAPTLSQAGGLVGDPDTAVLLDGSTQYITSTYPAFVNGRPLTVAGLAYRNTSTTGDTLFGGDTAGRPQLRIAANSTDVNFLPDVSVPSQVALFPNAWPGNGVWVHWVLIFDESADDALLYINGVLVGQQGGTLTQPYNASPGNFKLGADGTGAGGPFDGSLDEVAVFERILTSAEIAQLALAAFGTIAQALTATSTTTVTITSQVGKSLAADATLTPTLTKQVGKPLTANSTITASLVKQVSKAVSATSTLTATVVKQAQKPLATTATLTATLIKRVGKAVSATSTTTASFVRQVGKALATTSTLTATVARQVQKALSATTTTTATFVRQVGKILAAMATTTATVVKRVTKTLAATSTATATLAAMRVFLITLSATVTTTATMVRQVGKVLLATPTAVVTIGKAIAFGMMAVVTGIPFLIKQVRKSFGSTTTTTATIGTELPLPPTVRWQVDAESRWPADTDTRWDEDDEARWTEDDESRWPVTTSGRW